LINKIRKYCFLKQ